MTTDLVHNLGRCIELKASGNYILSSPSKDVIKVCKSVSIIFKESDYINFFFCSKVVKVYRTVFVFLNVIVIDSASSIENENTMKV